LFSAFKKDNAFNRYGNCLIFSKANDQIETFSLSFKSLFRSKITRGEEQVDVSGGKGGGGDEGVSSDDGVRRLFEVC
jgi:hypothetical protein